MENEALLLDQAMTLATAELYLHIGVKRIPWIDKLEGDLERPSQAIFKKEMFDGNRALQMASNIDDRLVYRKGRPVNAFD